MVPGVHQQSLQLQVMSAPNWVARALAVAAAVALLTPPRQVHAQVRRAIDNPRLQQRPPNPGSAITAVDLTTGLVSGREDSTGHTFIFRVVTLSGSDSAILVHGLVPGQRIWADLHGKGVEVVYGKLCCGIISETDH